MWVDMYLTAAATNKQQMFFVEHNMLYVAVLMI